MRFWAIVGLAGLFVPSLGLAENVKQAIELLSTPEAECRYVTTLASTARASLHRAQELRAEAEQLVTAGECSARAQSLVQLAVSK